MLTSDGNQDFNFFFCKLLNSGLSGQPGNFALEASHGGMACSLQQLVSKKCVEGISSQPRQFEEKALCVFTCVSKHELVSFLLSGAP